ncbi:MAG: hypothetical protein EHM17_12340, partial [Verrucomicrobiaceae bacterium]
MKHSIMSHSRPAARPLLSGKTPRFTAPCALACLGLLTPALTATSIRFAGTETGEPVENWSNPNAPKALDADGNNRYGSAGYYQITP